MHFFPWSNLPASAALWTAMDAAKGLTVGEEGICLLNVGEARPQSALVFESVLPLESGTIIVGELGESENTLAERLAASVEGCSGIRRFAAAKGERMVFDDADVPSLVFYDENGILCAAPVDHKVVKLAPRDGGVTGTPGDNDCDGNVGG